MKRYHTYKDSGIEWLGEIPKHWEVSRIKDIFDQISSNGSELEENTYVPLENIESFTGKLLKKVSNDNNESTNLFKSGDILLNKLRPYLGKILLPDFDGGVSGEVVVLRSNILFKNDVEPKYFFYRFLSTKFIFKINSLSDGVKMPRTNPTKILGLEMTVPPFPEQTAIVQYLDTKTQAIDQKVRLLEKKIGYYKELRQSIINEAVTKGLDNKVEWKENEFGFKTPIKWVKKRLKDLGTLYSGLSGKSGDDFNQDDNPNNKGFIPFTNIANNTYLQKDNLGTVVVFDGERQNEVRKGDIFFLMSSEGYGDIGKSAVLAEELKDTYLNSFCRGFRINQKTCNPYFLNYLLLSDYYRQILIIEGKGFTRINLKMEKINDFEVYLPLDLDIQFEIVTYLDQKTQTIDKIIANIQKQKTVLKEFRKTLINEVVTGKKRVYEPKSSAVV
ncbi:restriction endonuclease subunit S [Aequorivita viscosa]|jgi:type I restriction enzyme S subunit|uniref:Type I restriction enzyme, S subunit n=1 Tax=Aequorivita viscosa TaxID=797419 RepID=A0A1M6H0I6_9FLAO|nr:restriction endonuclease subunit S [Aequorivita viscosa]SDW80721.1 type I restriction enzyme, S subunit [Aequorivita viscosa]SHJ15700.1 type I restriction enzyme, S subunit [Aequorivita viscosa]